MSGLKRLPDKSIDLVVTSPPYSDVRKSYKHIAPEKYVEWFLPISKEILRVLSADGAFILNINDRCKNKERIPFVFDLVLQMRKQGYFLIDTIIWVKKNGLGSTKAKRAFDYFEYIFHFGKSVDVCFNADKIRTPYTESSLKRAQSPIKRNTSNRETRLKKDDNTYKKWILNEKGSFPKNVLSFKKDSGKDHIAAFDISLPLYFIKAYSNPGDTILDPFCGRGTTCQAVKTINQSGGAPRKYIGFEIDKNYVKLAKNKYGLVVNEIK